MKKVLCIMCALAFCLFAASCAAPESGAAEAPVESSAVQEESAAPADSAENTGVGGIALPATNTRPEQTGNKLVYTAELEIETKQFDASCQAISKALAQYGGYISSEHTSGNPPTQYGDSGRRSELILRVPVEHYAAFLDALSGTGNVLSRNQNVEDISGQYYDTESRIELLEARYARLKGHLEKAVKMSDVIELESEMSELLSELDTLKGQRKGWDNLVAYTTITVYLSERVDYGAVAPVSGDSITAADAFSKSLKGVGVFFSDLWIWLAGALPVIGVLALLAGAVLAITRPCVRLSRKRRAKKHAAQQPSEREA